jgi:hypothetical protein
MVKRSTREPTLTEAQQCEETTPESVHQVETADHPRQMKEGPETSHIQMEQFAGLIHLQKEEQNNHQGM